MTKAEQPRLVTFRSKFLEHAKRCGNIAATRRFFGISRQKFHTWKKRFGSTGQRGWRTSFEHHTAARTRHRSGG